MKRSVIATVEVVDRGTLNGGFTMKNTFVRTLAIANSFLFVALFTEVTLAQRAAYIGQGRLEEVRAPGKDSPTNAVAAGSGPSIEVRKTAFVDGHEVCGVIRITNSGGQAATITGIADSLEVHFPRGATPPVPPPAGSTALWYKVADVPIEFVLPASIAPGATTTIPYCFSLCLAGDYAGANSMRNVVTVTATNASGGVRTFTTRSISFPPPTLDCQACCLPNGDCADTVPDACTAEGGLSKGSGTDCGTTRCTQACCLPSGSCSDETLSACEADAGSPLGLGTACAAANTTCLGACCYPTDCYNNMAVNDCEPGGRFLGHGTTCETQIAACPNGACCIDETCFDHTGQDHCESFPALGSYLGDGTTCATTPECPRGCCYLDGACDDQPPSECLAAGGRPHEPGQRCRDTLGCPLACCFDDGSCADRVAPFCLPPNAIRLGPGTECATSQCPEFPHGCCYPDGACQDQLPSECLAAGGKPHEPGQLCMDTLGCPQACCFVDGSCYDRVAPFCIPPTGIRLGPGTECATSSCTVACCFSDGSCNDLLPGDCTGNPQGPGTSCSDLVICQVSGP